MAKPMHPTPHLDQLEIGPVAQLRNRYQAPGQR